VLTSRGVQTEIENLLSYLLESEIAVYAQPVLISEGRVSWRTAKSTVPFMISHGHPSVLDYRHWVSNGQYSALLADGAVLQLTYDFSGHLLVGHRLAYVPCPYNFTDLNMPLDPADLLDLYDDCRVTDIVLASAIRFDFDPRSRSHENSRWTHTHPDSHLTINSISCRIPCAAPLRLGTFIEFVFKHFYPHWWASHKYLRYLSRDGLNRTVTEEERLSLHIAWAL
jgi:hypothetical protein